MVNSACGHFRAIRDCSSALIPATRSSGRVRDTETMTSPTILAPLGLSRIASIPATLGVVHDQALDRVGQPLGRAVDERVDRRPAQAIACDGDEAGDADRRQRIGVGESRASRDESKQDENGCDEIARIMQRVGAERVARGRARRMGQRPPAHDVDDDREQGSRRWRKRRRRPQRRRRGCAGTPGSRRRSRARREGRSRPAPPPPRSWRGQTDDRRRRVCRPRARRKG